jgi:PAS domain S-box-containing protein
MAHRQGGSVPTSSLPDGQPAEALDRLTRLQALTASLSEAVSSEQVADAILAQAAAVLGACAGVVARLSDDGTEFVSLRTTGYPEEAAAPWRRFSADAPLPLCDAVRDRQPVLLANLAERDARYPEIARTPGVQAEGALAALPLVVRGQAVGGIGLRFPAGRAVTEQDRAFLLTIGGLCAQALERARLFDTERAARERAECAEDALRASEQRHRLLSDLTSDFTFGLRFVGNGPPLVEWVSEGFTKFSGFTLEELNRRGGWPALVHPDDLPITFRTVERVRAGYKDESEVRLVVQSGEVRWVRYLTQPVRDGAGRVTGFVGAAQDVHERKRAELALRESEARFRSVVESNMIGIGFWDAEGRLTDPNDALLRMTGHTREEFASGRVGWHDLTPPEHRPRDEKALAQIRATGSCDPYEKEYVRKDGSRVPVLIGGGGFEGRDRGPFFALDVSALKRAERDAPRSEPFYRLLAEAVPGMAWSASTADGLDYLSRRWEEYTGLSLGQIRATGWESPHHPDEVAGIRERFLEAARTGRPFEMEFRYRRHDGLYRWFLGRQVPIPDPDGRGLRWVGTFIDIDDRKRAEAALRESEGRFARFMQHLPGLAWIKDAQGRYAYANGAAVNAFGKPRAELYGQTDEEVFPPATAAQFKENDRKALAGAGVRVVETLGHPDGALHHSLVSKFPIPGPDGGSALVGGMAIDITEEVRTRAVLEESEERFRATFEQAAVGIAHVGPDGRWLRVNRKLCDIVGYGPDELLALTFQDITHPDDLEADLAQVRRLLAGEIETYAMQKRYFRKDGSLVWINLTVALVRTPQGRPKYFISVVEDITGRRRAEAASARRSEQVRRLAEVATRINAARDVSATMRLVTEEARTLIGSHQAVAGFTVDQNWAQAINAVSLSDKYARWRGYDTKPDGSGIYSLVCRTNRPLRLTQAELEAHPAWRGFGQEAGRHPPLRGWLAAPLVGRDGRNIGLLQMSDKEEGEFTEDDEAVLVQLAQMASVAVENARLVESLRDADRRKDEFLATLAHELRNPLAPLRNGLQVMKLAGGNAAAVEQARGMMERQLAQMVRLIDDLLDVSRITRGKLELRRERVELASVVQSAVEGSRPLIEASAHRLTVSLPPEPVSLEADPVRLAQVLANLLTNAAKYTDAGGHIRLTAERQGGELVVAVRDNGIGLAAEHLPRLFEMFSQVAPALERSQGGLGIGLALVKGLVEMHGGTVEAHSEGPGRGSEFVVRLPEAVAGDGLRPEAGSGTAARRTPSRRIVVADDNRDAADSLALLLRLAGHEVHAVHDGQGAVEAAAWFKPDVAFLDLGMPRLNGLEAARRIREQPWGQNILLVAVTGWGQEEDKRRAAEAGFDRHLTKPVDPAALQEVVART